MPLTENNTLELEACYNYIAGRFLVTTNGSGEVFISFSDKVAPMIRVSDTGESIIVTSSGDSRISPTSVNGLDAFRISEK